MFPNKSLYGNSLVTRSLVLSTRFVARLHAWLIETGEPLTDERARAAMHRVVAVRLPITFSGQLRGGAF